MLGYTSFHFLVHLESLTLKSNVLKWTDFNFLVSQTNKFFNIKLKEFERFIKKKKTEHNYLYYYVYVFFLKAVAKIIFSRCKKKM